MRAPERNRTFGRRIRNPVLYPLSYEGKKKSGSILQPMHCGRSHPGRCSPSTIAPARLSIPVHQWQYPQ